MPERHATRHTRQDDRTPGPRTQALSGCINLGPKSAALLARIGITSLDQVRDAGAVAVYRQARAVEPRVTLNLLWALEGAVSDLPWQVVAREHRTSLLLALEDPVRAATREGRRERSPPGVRLFPLPGARRQDASVEAWFAAPQSATRMLARKWFDEWCACGEDVGQLLHDGHPTVCVQGTALGYVNAFAAHVNVGFFLGATLPDPAGLLRGTGRFMRHVQVRPGEPGSDGPLRALVRVAYADLRSRLRERPPPTAAPARGSA